jgi:VWFA-related protein
MKVRIAFILFALSGIMVDAAAQRLHEVLIRRVTAEEYPKLSLFVSVKDISLQPIGGLNAADFDVREDGQEVEIDSVASVRALGLPVSCVVAIDISGSMAKDQRLENAKAVAADFIRRLDARDRVALISFGTEVTLVRDFTADKSELEESIATLRTEETGYTHLYDAVHQSQVLALAQKTERSLIVILTDGKDEGSFLKEDDVILESQKSSLPVYAIGFGVQADIPERVLGRIATLSGGAYQYAMTYTELNSLFNRLTDDLYNEYVLNYDSSLLSDGQWHDISLKVTARGDTVSYSKRFQTPIIAGFWTARRIILAVTLLLLILVGGGVYVRRRAQAKAAKESSVGAQQAGGRATATAESTSSSDDQTVLMGPSTSVREEDRTRLIGKAPSLKAWFVLVGKSSKGRELMVETIPAVIGRSSKANVRIQDQTVSSEHAKLHLVGRSLYLNDLASTNGTIVNNAKIVKIELHDNDRVKFGDVETVFKCVWLTDEVDQK